jgi:hypothetical protein
MHHPYRHRRRLGQSPTILWAQRQQERREPKETIGRSQIQLYPCMSEQVSPAVSAAIVFDNLISTKKSPTILKGRALPYYYKVKGMPTILKGSSRAGVNNSWAIGAAEKCKPHYLFSLIGRPPDSIIKTRRIVPRAAAGALSP